MTQKKPINVEKIKYQPSNHYLLDLEIFTVSSLRRRTGKKRILNTFNYEFYMLILITSGECTQIIDFRSELFGQGDIFLIKPGQTHNFSDPSEWDGWVILFKSSFLLSDRITAQNIEKDESLYLQNIPFKTTLSKDNFQRVNRIIEQMLSDSTFDASIEEIHSLLRYQILIIFQLLSLLKKRQKSNVSVYYSAKFREFQSLVEKKFCFWHRVSLYADALGCTEKTLNRYTLHCLGITPKKIILSRINLQAKRMITTTDLSIANIAEKLGFNETTNFTKFFKKENKCTPTTFRNQNK
ncbi:AraC family transcriptional regulator [Vibrio rumoiensis]|uniref:AraC family transcriptional regulator n=1 Tax=Vibrio rumoiensis TaxID=76258 RepID=UPI003AA8014A